MYDVVEVGQPPTPPPGVGVLYAANHPNALLDGALLMYALRVPRYTFFDTLYMAVADFPIGFIAKATLFNLPIFGTFLRWAGAIPIHRAQDAPASNAAGPSRAASNKSSFSAISNRLRQNGHVAIFPEGISHMEAHVMPLYTGITRMALDAAQGAFEVYFSITEI
jgi:glycerol-3-phosphate O-acyltransferase/dihydroxyacetone phosphate acyltransferase